MIALICSVPNEGKRLIQQLRRELSVGGKAIYRGKILAKDVVYAVSGIGKTNAAHAATILIEKFSPELLILLGVGGAYPSTGLEVGDIAVAVKEVYGDEGVATKNGFHGTEAIGIPFLRKGRKNYFNEFPLDKKLAKEAAKIISRILCDKSPHPPFTKGGLGGIKKRGGWEDLEVKSGTFVTVSTCTGTKKRARDLKERFHAICENMEGASVAHICALYGTPMIEIRGVSNIVEDRDRRKWDIKLAAQNCQLAVMEILKNL